MDKLYSVEDLAQACNTTPRAVRLYMEKGLLEPMRAGRTYVFTVLSVDKLNLIQRCKRIGLSLDDIKTRLNANSENEINAMIARVKNIADDAHAELKALSEQLNHMRHTDRS